VTPEELRDELARGTLRPAYLLAGEEALLRDDALAALREAALAVGPEDFNFDRLDGDTATPAALLDAVRALPVMAPHRLVVVREPEGRRGASRGLGEALREAVAGLDGATGVVLVVTAAKADGRAGWVRAFRDPAAVVRCDPPRGAREVTAFVRAEAARQALRFEPGAAEALAERTGAQLLMLRQEIAKLSLLAGPGEPVTRAHVVSGASDVAEERIWELTDAIGGGRVAEALGAMVRLLRTGAPEPLLLGALASHFRKLLRLRAGGSVGGPPFVVRKLKGQAQRYSRARLLGCLRAIHETDLALKGEGALPPPIALERLVMALSG
jgi:DNA polymerase-3 subunit delta